MSTDSPINQDEVKSDKKSNFWQKLKKTYVEYKPYLVSHHPNCKQYEEHVFIIKDRKFCIGCFIGYPSAILGIGLSILLVIFEIIPNYVNLFIGIVLSLAVLLSLTQFPNKRKRKILQKFMIGVGSGFIISSMWFFLGLAWYFKILIVWAAIIVINIPISLMHYQNHEKICRNCEWKNNWSECPGFKHENDLKREISVD